MPSSWEAEATVRTGGTDPIVTQLKKGQTMLEYYNDTGHVMFRTLNKNVVIEPETSPDTVGYDTG